MGELFAADETAGEKDRAGARTTQARKAAFKSWANTPDRTARNAPGHRAAEARFEALADPNGEMSEEARRKAADALRHAHFEAMAIKSADVRRRKLGLSGERAGRHLSLWASNEMADAIEREADRAGMTVSAWLRALVSTALQETNAHRRANP